MKKKIVAICMMMLLIITLRLDNVSAANTGDTEFYDFKATILGYSKISTKGRIKEDNSAVYVYIENSSPYNTVRARALGSTTEGGNWTNRTWISGQGEVEYVTLTSGIHYEIHNVINERGETYANVSFHSTGQNANYLDGRWSPDCAGSYTYALM